MFEPIDEQAVGLIGISKSNRPRSVSLEILIAPMMLLGWWCSMGALFDFQVRSTR